MKKFFVFILLIVSFFSFSVISYATPKEDKFVGTYDIIYFFSKSSIYVFNSDSSICDKYKYGTKTQCRIHPTDLVLGEAQISKNKNGQYIIESKMQIYNKLLSLSTPTDLYNYSKYSPVNLVGNVLNGDNQVLSVTGRNLIEKFDMPKSSIKVYEMDGFLRGEIDLYDKCVVAIGSKLNVSEVKTIIHLKKKSNKTTDNYYVQKRLIQPKNIDPEVWSKFETDPKDSSCK